MTPSIESKYNHYYSQLCKHLKLKGLQPKTIAAYSHGVRRIAHSFSKYCRTQFYTFVIFVKMELAHHLHIVLCHSYN